jgi:acyl-CoA thioester hydrolase
MREAFHWPVRIYWEDTDAGGVVYHARYLAFMERARSEWLRAHDIHQAALRECEDLVFAVRAMDLDFHAPARLDDQLRVSVRLLESRGASFVVAQRIERGDVLLVQARVRVAALRASDFRPRPVPSFLSDILKHLLETE